MVSNLEELGELLENNNLTPADVEYIVKFMEKEEMSPQLAMRRIKAFETLKAKLEDNKDKETIDLLEEELHQVKNQLLERNKELERLREEKSGLESVKEELETKTELMDSEKEELQKQLELIKEMQFDDEEINEIEEIRQFITYLDEIIQEKQEIEPVLLPIKMGLEQIADEQEITFDKSEFIQQVDAVFEKSQTEPKTTSQLESKPDAPGSKPVGKPKESSTQEKPADKKPKKVEKPEKPEKKVSDKEEQVLNLFLEFVEEAETDKGFKERVSTICDMDEAYQYLGSIGLSQVYSYASRGMDKKQDLIDLLKSWKKDGIPR